MALSNFGKSALRVTKNYSKGYSHTQIKTRNATCNDPWPPSGKEMFELSQLSYRQYAHALEPSAILVRV